MLTNNDMYCKSHDLTPLFYRPEHRVTVCILRDVNTANIVARGVAVCSEKDQMVKKVGQLIAMGMALRAYKNKLSSGMIMGNNKGAQDSVKFASTLFNFYSEHCPVPTEDEKELAKSVKRI